MAIEGLSSSSELLERAKEELQMLETHHPDRFGYLKSELQSFILLLREQHAPPIATTSSSVALTQVSSTTNNKKSNKKRKSMDYCGNQESPLRKSRKNSEAQGMVAKRKDRVDMVLERAQLCLQKIRDVKSSLF